jgi:OOP family OmpA-OmpF porin
MGKRRFFKGGLQMKHLAVFMLSIAVLCVIAAPVAAEEREGAVSLSPFIGGYTFDGALHLKTAPLYGLRIGYDLTKDWEVEAVGSFLATEGTHSNASVNTVNYRVDVLYNILPDGPLVPYLAIGAGGVTAGHGSDFNAGGRNTDATANGGLGLKYFITDSIALRADAREVFVFENHSDPLAHNSVMYNEEYTAGLTFLFGGTTASATQGSIPAPLAPTTSMSVMPDTISTGNTATLKWTTDNATSCNIQPGIGGVMTQGSMAISPSVSTVYSLSCTGPGGTSNSTANITVVAPVVIPAPTSSLTVTPNPVTQGESAVLNWNTQNAKSCDIQPGIGHVNTQGNASISPLVDTTYALNCSGPGGNNSSTVNVSVIAPPPAPTKPAPVVLNPEKAETVNLLIDFDFNKSVIKPQFYPNVDAAGEFMQKYPTVTMTIEGNTDNVGTKAYNQKLSERRAKAVKNYIVNKFGINTKLIKAVGYGKTRPIDTNKTAQGRYHNRRVHAVHAAVK